MKPTFVRITVMLFCLLMARSSFAFVNTPVIYPANPTENQQVSIKIDAGYCDFFTGGVDDGHVSRDGSNIRMYLASRHIYESQICVINPSLFRFTFNIGVLPAGTYHLTVVRHYESFATNEPEIEETIGNLTFDVVPSDRVEIPALDTLWMIVLAAALILLAAGAAKSQHRRSQ